MSDDISGVFSNRNQFPWSILASSNNLNWALIALEIAIYLLRTKYLSIDRARTTMSIFRKLKQFPAYSLFDKVNVWSILIILYFQRTFLS